MKKMIEELAAMEQAVKFGWNQLDQSTT